MYNSSFLYLNSSLSYVLVYNCTCVWPNPLLHMSLSLTTTYTRPMHKATVFLLPGQRTYTSDYDFSLQVLLPLPDIKGHYSWDLLPLACDFPLPHVVSFLTHGHHNKNVVAWLLITLTTVHDKNSKKSRTKHDTHCVAMSVLS